MERKILILLVLAVLCHELAAKKGGGGKCKAKALCGKVQALEEKDAALSQEIEALKEKVKALGPKPTTEPEPETTPAGACHDNPKTVTGNCCAIPFIYDGVLYDKCITDNNGGVLWCATVLNYDVNPQWEECA